MGIFSALRRDLKGLAKYYGLAQWLLRIALLVYVYVNYGKRLMYFDFSSEYFLLSVVYFLGAIFIFLGGFSKTSEITRTFAVITAIVLTAHLAASFILYKSIDSEFSDKLLFLGVLFYFATLSKRNDFYWRQKHHHESVEVEELLSKREDSSANS